MGNPLNSLAKVRSLRDITLISSITGSLLCGAQIIHSTVNKAITRCVVLLTIDHLQVLDDPRGDMTVHPGWTVPFPFPPVIDDPL